MELIQKVKGYDLLGATASGLCAVHCTFTPLILAVRPALQNSIGSETRCIGIWAALDYVFLVLSFIAVWYTSQHSNQNSIKASLWAGWALFAGGLLFQALNLSLGKCFMYTGSISLVIIHLINITYCARCNYKKKSGDV